MIKMSCIAVLYLQDGKYIIILYNIMLQLSVQQNSNV